MNARPTPAEIMQAEGVPNRRMEDWKYTDLRAAYETLANKAERYAGLGMVLPKGIEPLGLGPEELPTWVLERVRSAKNSGVMDAAARSLLDRCVVRVPPGAYIEMPAEIEHRTSGHGSAAFFVEARASLTIQEMYEPSLDGLSNMSLLFFLGKGANVTLFLETPFNRAATIVETVTVVQERDSTFRLRGLLGGGKLSRIELNIALNGEGAEADLSGVSVLGDEAHADITTRITHAAPNTTSRQLFKKVAGGKSRAIYQGKITVKEGAIGSDSRQTAKALLLSNHAEADLKPELEILADDVKCAHGAAVGDLDADSLFYLRSRGIPEEAARGLLVHAFLQEVVDGIEDEGMRKSALAFIDEGLNRAMRSAA